ncbi:MAG: hypothetical protein MUC87_08105 [Bacteroidia bacterium]|jgi:hypothetical protein|nr:hypothetical protein [Bacteroidia bacterium]
MNFPIKYLTILCFGLCSCFSKPVNSADSGDTWSSITSNKNEIEKSSYQCPGQHTIILDSTINRICIINNDTVSLNYRNLFTGLFINRRLVFDSLLVLSDILYDNSSNRCLFSAEYNKESYLCVFSPDVYQPKFSLVPLSQHNKHLLKFDSDDVYYFKQDEEGTISTIIYKYNFTTQDETKVIQINADNRKMVLSYHSVPLLNKTFVEIGNWDGGGYNIEYYMIDNMNFTFDNVTNSFSFLGNIDNCKISSVDFSQTDNVLYFYFYVSNPGSAISVAMNPDLKNLGTNILFKEVNNIGFVVKKGVCVYNIVRSKYTKNRNFVVGIDPCYDVEKCFYSQINNMCISSSDSIFVKYYKKVYNTRSH